MTGLGDHVEERRLTLGDEGAGGRRLIGVSNEAGLHASTRRPSADLSRYQRVERDWFAYNPMRADVGSIGLADDDEKVGFTSPDYVVFSCRESLDPRYLLAFLKSDYGLEAIVRNSSGAVRKRLYFTGLAEIDLPIPSLAEQRAVVAKLADTEQKLNAIRAANASAEELARLRQSILDEAVRGRLTAPWRAEHPVDEPAPALLARIATERARLVKEKKLRKTKPLPPLAPDEQPFDLPHGWAWCRLNDVADHTMGKMLDKNRNEGVEVPYLRNLNVRWYRVDIDDLKTMKVRADHVDRYSVARGDILVCEGGGGIGRTAVWTSDKGLIFQKALHRIRFISSCVEPLFFNHLMRLYSRSGFLDDFYTGSGIPHLTGASIKKLPIPLPPLAEQTAIVTRVASLFSTCDTLDREVTCSAAHATTLLRAVLREAFAPATSMSETL